MKRPLPWLALLLGLVPAALAGACSDDDPKAAATTPTPTTTPSASSTATTMPTTTPTTPPPTLADCRPVGAANELTSSDERFGGQCMFLLEAWGTEQLDHWPPTDFMRALMTSEPEVFGNQYASFGFLADPNDDFPIGFKRGLVDATKMKETCAVCHVGTLPDGRVWLGAPNHALDLGRFRYEVNKRWVAAGHAPFMTEVEQQKALALGPGRFNAETSSYPQVVPADFPPYFELAKRKHLNYMGTGANVRSEVFLSIYSFGAGSPTEDTAKVPFPADERLDVFLSYFGTIPSPDAPAQDAGQVAQGAQVFQASGCGGCHHLDDPSLNKVTQLDKEPDGKERLPDEDPTFPRGSIRTSALHRVLQDGDGSGMSPGVDEGYADLLKFILSHKLKVAQTDGYRTAELHGVWATAPYLHNGSVPTLEALLSPPAERPTLFDRAGFTLDTTIKGNSNEGHAFGTTLPDADKAALIAYLKSL